MRSLVTSSLLAAALVALSPSARADQQKDPGLRAIIEAAIKDKPCFAAKYDDVVWFALMQPRVEARLRAQPPDLRLGDDVGAAAQRILHAVSCEANKHAMLRDRPQLVLAVIDVESHFRKYAVSRAGARGLMQVMPFWVEQLGGKADNLFHERTNLRYGCVILRHYLDRERGNMSNALARYNGSLGQAQYPQKVLRAWKERWALSLPA